MAGRLATPSGSRQEFVRLARTVRPELIDIDGWRTLDRIERERGRAAGRPRAKFTEPAEMVAAVSAAPDAAGR
jgi:ferredoxin--NADP+ reductase